MPTTLYMTDTASDINPGANIEKRLLLTRGGGLATGTVNTALGPQTGISWTATAGGTIIEWFTMPLDPVTISGSITANCWVSENNMSANATPRYLIEKVSGAGAFVATIIGMKNGTEMAVTTRAAMNWSATPGSAVAVSSGERLRVRIQISDATATTMAATFTCSLGYAGTSGGADGDTFLTFTEDVYELGTTPTQIPWRSPYSQLLGH